MSTEATFQYDDTDLADGRLHSLPCPSPEHEGEPGNHDLLVRFAASVTVIGAPSGVWLLRCWSSLCSYDSIAESLGIDLPRVRGSVARLLPYLAAVHDNDEMARPASHSRVHGRSCTPVTRTGAAGRAASIRLNRGIHMEERGGPFRAPTLLLWGTDTDGTALVVVGDVRRPRRCCTGRACTRSTHRSRGTRQGRTPNRARFQTATGLR